MSGDPILMLTLALLALAIGVFLGLYWAKSRQPKATKPLAGKIPTRWPLHLRTVVRPNEAIIWRWLRAAFPNQRVLLKLPFSRFTSPDAEAGREYYELLNGLYASFTITDREGNVLGCIDLGGAQASNASSERIKETVLHQLGIAYEVLQGTRLPTPAALRAAILNTHQDMPSESTFEELDDARTQLQELLGRQRVRRPDGTGEFRTSELGRLTDSIPPSSWQSL